MKTAVRWIRDLPPTVAETIRRHGLVTGLWELTVVALIGALCLAVFTYDYAARTVTGRTPLWMATRRNWWSEPFRHRLKETRRALEERRRDRSFREHIAKPAEAAARARRRITPQSAAAAVALRTSEPTDYFFGRLPYELRAHIYQLTFPPRMLHMYLRYGPAEPRVYHSLISEDLQEEQEREEEQSHEFRWNWAGSVCDPPYWVTEPESLLSHGRRRGWYGYCACKSFGPFSRRADVRTLPRERCDDTGTIDMAEWLRVCQQAYIEGMRHLYGENTIILSSPPLLRGFQTLASWSITFLITSLELTWNPSIVPLLEGFRGHHHHDADNPAVTPTTPVFPSLVHLRIFLLQPDHSPSPQSQRRPIAGVEDHEEWGAIHLPLKVDGLVERIAPPAAEVRVTYYGWKWYQALDMALIREQGVDVTKPQICRDLGGLKCWRRMPAGPAASGVTTNREETDRGYWFHVDAQAVRIHRLTESDYAHQELYGFRTAEDLRSAVPSWEMTAKTPNGQLRFL